jgi:hypothetical protein
VPARPPTRVLLAVALIAACTLALQVALTRVFSAALFYHFGFLAISLALVGTGAAAMVIYLRPRWFEPSAPAASLAPWCAALATSLVVAPAVLVRLDYSFESSITLSFALTLALASLVASVPFFCAGMAITLAITQNTRWVHRVYASDLLGAGLGALAVVPVMWSVPAPVLLAALGLVAAVATVLCADSTAWRRRAIAVITVALVAVGLGATTSLYELAPAIEGDTVADRWTPLSRVVGYASTGSPRFGTLTYDRDYAPVPRHQRGEPLPDWRSLQLGPQSIGFEVAPPGRSLVIGGGGGRDIYNALSSGERRVDVIELNRAIVDVVDDDLGQSFGSPYSLPGVDVQIGDGRSTLAQSDARYEAINLGFTNTLSGNAAQGYALTENNLYTTEAMDEYFDHLARGGLLMVSRIYRLVGDEALRATVLTLAALEDRGVENPARHVMVLLGKDLLTAKPFGTVLAQLSPFTPSQLTRMERLASERGARVAFAPGGPYRLEWKQLARASSLEAFCSGYRVDVCPTTDDKPFFLNFERLGQIGQATPPGYLFTVKPFTVLLVALGILLALCVLAFLLPLALVARSDRPPLGSLVLFAAIGIGFLVFEISMIQRFVLFLGFPTYSLSVVLAALLAFTGLGAGLSGRWRSQRRALTLGMLSLSVLIVVAAFGLRPLLAALIDLPFAARILVTGLVLAPYGLLMGMAMPIGLRTLSSLYPRGVPWAWGINGVTSVLASVLALTVAITAGFTVATLVAAACYAVAAGQAMWGRWPPDGDEGFTRAGRNDADGYAGRLRRRPRPRLRSTS